MGLEKAIESGKEKRRPYYGSKRIDGSCRNHQGCPICEGNRLRQRRLQEIEAMEAESMNAELMSPGELEERFIAPAITNWLEGITGGGGFDELPYAARCELVVILEELAEQFPVAPPRPARAPRVVIG